MPYCQVTDKPYFEDLTGFNRTFTGGEVRLGRATNSCHKPESRLGILSNVVYLVKGVAAMWQTGVNLTYENN
jgi:hypothetical protein